VTNEGFRRGAETLARYFDIGLYSVRSADEFMFKYKQAIAFGVVDTVTLREELKVVVEPAKTSDLDKTDSSAEMAACDCIGCPSLGPRWQQDAPRGVGQGRKPAENIIALSWLGRSCGREKSNARADEFPPRAFRVPAVYLKVANWAFLAFLPFRRINKLRAINSGTGFDSLRACHVFNELQD
jgi:hypothetical protein